MGIGLKKSVGFTKPTNFTVGLVSLGEGCHSELVSESLIKQKSLCHSELDSESFPKLRLNKCNN